MTQTTSTGTITVTSPNTLTSGNHFTTIDTLTLGKHNSYTVNTSGAVYTDTIDNVDPSIRIGKHKLNEEQLGKLLALLDLIEGCDSAELSDMFKTQIAMNRIKND